MSATKNESDKESVTDQQTKGWRDGWMKRGVESHVRDKKSLDLISALLITAEKMVTPSPQHETLLNLTQNVILLPL